MENELQKLRALLSARPLHTHINEIIINILPTPITEGLWLWPVGFASLVVKVYINKDVHLRSPTNTNFPFLHEKVEKPNRLNNKKYPLERLYLYQAISCTIPSPTLRLTKIPWEGLKLRPYSFCSPLFVIFVLIGSMALSIRTISL